MATRVPALIAVLAWLAPAGPAAAQVDGSVSVMVDVLPESSAVEARARLFAERADDLTDHIRVRLSGYVDALLAERNDTTARDAIVRPQELYVEFHGERAELRVGTSRVVWGRLDEFQPTDVVNPIDLSRFLLEGRAEARLPVVMVRGRWFLPGGTAIEGIVVPLFRAGVYDQLDEPASPFNLDPPVTTLLPVVRREPADTWRNVQGGARVTTTAGRVDIGASAYYGFRAFPASGFELPPSIVKRFPRFTMIGADFETVRGAWGVRGEAAAMVGDGEFEGGIGLDRRAGSYRVAGNVLWAHASGDDDFSLVVSADRAFARETRTARVFAVYNPADGTAFARGTVAASLRDNLSLEGSVGVFTGTSTSTIGLLSARDFGYIRLKVFF